MEALNHRIVLVSGGIQLGGATTFLLNFAGELVRRGMPVLVLSFERENPYASDFQRLGVQLQTEDESKNIYEDRLSSVLHATRTFQPTAVISCLGPESFEVLRYVPAGVRRIGMVQSDDPTVYAMVEKYAASLDAIAGVSLAIVKRLQERPLLRAVAKPYLPYGVAIPGERLLPQSAGGPLRILFLGRLAHEQKRVHLFPRILASLQKAGIPFVWTIAGEGPDRAGLVEQMRSDRPDEVIRFTGPISYGEVPALIDQHDIFLLTSDYEGLPLSLLEAMAHGLVPVVSDLESGLREVVDDTNGLLVPPEDVEGYGRAIVSLHKQRDALAAKSAAARQRVRSDYSVQAMTDRWLNFLQLNRGAPGPWPGEFRVRGILGDTQKWKYTRPVRWLRRRLRRG